MKSYLFLVFGSFLAVSHGYSAGAPNDEEICKTMVPGHPADPQKIPFPFSITVDKREVKAGDEVELKLRTRSRSQKFRGYFVMGRNSNYEEDHKPVGTFLAVDNPDSSVVGCYGLPGSAITHRDGEIKTTVPLKWTAPTEKGTYVLLTTLVQDGKTFWVRQPSQNITVI